MAQEAKYVGQFDDMNLSDAWENYAMLVGYLTNTYKIPLSQIKSLFDAITELIPSAATPLNQLADKAYVDFGVEQMAAKYLSADAQGNPFSSYQAFEQGPFYYAGSIATPTKNDYALVNGDETHDGAITRYWYNGTSWDFQYVVNNTPLNQEQLAAINSTINATKVANYESHIANTTIHVTAQNKQDWNDKYNKPNDGIPKTDLSSEVQSSLDNADASVGNEQVLVEAVSGLKQDIEGLKNINTYDRLFVNELNLRSIPKIGDSKMILNGEGAPSLEPEFVGQAYLDTTNNILYYAFGTETTSWKSSQPTEIITDSVVDEIWNGVFV